MKKSNTPPQEKDYIIQTMEEVMHNSMMPYAEYVIMDRAIPRVEDGLKPVQRRILYTMMELGLTPDKPHRKSARIVGDCLGKYHPHGDSSVYDAMVRMAQDFNMQCPLVNGHGNFGSVDGDPAAAMRYTEARMTPLAMELLRDIEKETIPYSLNFDDTLKEPDLLPGRFPNLLVNGATGIAVGLATNIPPHNLGETIDAAIALLENSELPLEKVMKKIKGPDFPTGGYLLDDGDLKTAYETGRGRVAMRAKTHIETLKNGKKLIVIDELPYQVNKANALEKILKLSEDKKNLFAPISDIRDESDRNGMRAVIEVKRDTDMDKMMAYLYKYSDLQVNFNINMVAIANGKPQLMGLIPILNYYNAYQKDVVTRRTQFDLQAAERRAHVLEGLIIAVDAIDEIIRIIRASQTPAEAKQALMKRFKLTEIQAQAVLDMRLQRLTNLSIIELKKEHAELTEKIKELRLILADESKLAAVIKQEMQEIKKKHSVPRRTVFLDETPVIEIDESVTMPAEEVVVFMTKLGIKRMNPKTFENKGSGEAERVLWQIETRTNQRIQLFTNYGNMHAVDVSDIPEPKGKDRGVIPSGLIPGWQDGEKILSVFQLSREKKEQSILFLTKKGMAKRSAVSQYETRNKRLVACNVKKDDELLHIALDNEGKSILLITAQGMSIRFASDTVPETGRTTAGVKAIQLGANDTVIFAQQAAGEDGSLFVVSDRGYGKNSLLLDYEIQGRNGKGLRTFDFKKNHTNGEELVAACLIQKPCMIHIEQKNGEQTTFDSRSIRTDARFSKGDPLVMSMMDNIVTKAYCAPLRYEKE